MPIRATRQRREHGIRKYIEPLYTRPALRFLSGEEYQPLAHLIFGPPTSWPSREEIEKLKSDLAAATGPQQKEGLRANLQQAESYLAELQSMQFALPTLTNRLSKLI